MNPQKKRLLVYALIILSGFVLAFLFLPTKASKEKITAAILLPVEKDSLINTCLLSTFFNLENNKEAFSSPEKFYSGNQSCKLSPSIEYGIIVSHLLRNIPSHENIKTISVRFKCFIENDPDALYVLVVNDPAGKTIFWDGKPIVCDKTNEWCDSGIDYLIPPEYLKAENTVAVYPWNRNKKVFYVDDVRADFYGMKSYKPQTVAHADDLNLFFDFETTDGLSGTDAIKETVSHSGKKACDLSGGKEFGAAVNKKLNEIGSALPEKIHLSIWIFPLTDNPNTVLTTSVINSKNETVFWEGKSTENKPFPKNKWTKLNASFHLPVEKFHPDNVLGVGIWNKGKTDVIVDDLEIVYGEAPERRGEPPEVDAVSIYDKRFVSVKNKPPFQTIWFEKQEINNGNASSITASDKKNIIHDLSPNDDFLVGDFAPDKNNLDEILCLKHNAQGLFSYSPKEKLFKTIWAGNHLNSDSLWNSNNKFFCGDFNSDGKTDVLVVDKNNYWKIIHFNKTEWTIVSRGKDPKKEWIAKQDLPKTKIINDTDLLFPGNYIDNTETFLKLNTDWRFDLKLIAKESDGLRILGNIDFKGYPEDHNPKYYEFIKIIPGKFLFKDKTAVLVIMSNCADNDFNGRYCDQVEQLSHLPNSAQVYQAEIHNR